MSNRAKHTPGPWNFGMKSGDSEIIVAGGVALAEVFPTDCTEEEFEANAQLIKAAPELLEALKSLLGTWQCNPDHYAEEIEIYAPLIAQAEGK